MTEIRLQLSDRMDTLKDSRVPVMLPQGTLIYYTLPHSDFVNTHILLLAQQLALIGQEDFVSPSLLPCSFLSPQFNGGYRWQ